MRKVERQGLNWKITTMHTTFVYSRPC